MLADWFAGIGGAVLGGGGVVALIWSLDHAADWLERRFP